MTKEEIIDVISRAKYDVIDGEVKCTNVEYTKKAYASWNRTPTPTWDIINNEYRIIEEPEMIPLDFSDILDIKDEWLLDTRNNKICFVSEYVHRNNKVTIDYIDKYEDTTFEELQKYFVFKDTGKRLEKENK